MGGKGPMPKGHMSRERDQVRRHAQTVIVAEEAIYGIPIPEGFPWHPQTIAWWNTWRRSPLAKTWLDTDWDFLLDTAILHTQYWNRPSFALGAELRQRVAKLGATVEDRVRLKISVETPYLDESSPAGVTAINEYRRSLSG